MNSPAARFVKSILRCGINGRTVGWAERKRYPSIVGYFRIFEGGGPLWLFGFRKMFAKKRNDVGVEIPAEADAIETGSVANRDKVAAPARTKNSFAPTIWTLSHRSELLAGPFFEVRHFS